MSEVRSVEYETPRGPDWFWFVARTNTMHPPTLSAKRPNWIQRLYMGWVYGATAVYL